MAIDPQAGSSTPGGFDLNSFLQSAITGGAMGNIFGGNDGNIGNGLVLGLLLGRGGLFGNGIGNDGFGNDNASRAAIDSAVSAALAQNNQANNNAMLLLKDIQDSSQGLAQQIATQGQTNLIQQLQSQIAIQQGQANIGASIADAKGYISNEIHEVAADVTHEITGLSANIAAAFANTNNIVRDDGDKTRSAIAALAASIPNSRELELQRQLGVAEAQLLNRTTAELVRSGNVEVTNNINQTQQQQQQQQQLWNINNVLNDLLTAQKVTQGIVNLGTMTGNSQTAANTRVNS